MSLRSGLLLGCFAIGFSVTHCSGDSKNGGGDGSEPEAGSGGDAGEPGTGGTSGTRGGSSGTSGGGTAGRGGTSTGGTTSTGGAAGEGGAPSDAGEGGVGAVGGEGGSAEGGEGGGPTCMTTMPSGTLITLAQPTATFSQTIVAPFTVATAIDGMKDQLGWAVAPNSGAIAAQTAAFETAINTPSFSGGTRFAFVLTQNYTATGDHALGRFRLSVTIADRSTFADGNVGTATPGDVGASGIWSPLTPLTTCAQGGVELTTLSDASVLAGLHHVAPTVYVVIAETTLTGITGIRLEALQDPSLPFNGPGTQASNGNFVLTEFEVYVEGR